MPFAAVAAALVEVQETVPEANGPVMSWWPPARPRVDAPPRVSKERAARKALIAQRARDRGSAHRASAASARSSAPATVQYHLGKVCEELYISSRSQPGRVLSPP